MIQQISDNAYTNYLSGMVVFCFCCFYLFCIALVGGGGGGGGGVDRSLVVEPDCKLEGT